MATKIAQYLTENLPRKPNKAERESHNISSGSVFSAIAGMSVLQHTIFFVSVACCLATNRRVIEHLVSSLLCFAGCELWISV